MPTRSGVYSGHDWVVNDFSEKSQKQADEIAKKFGNYIYSQGYKGIFGIDLIVDLNGDVWPVECNPRETDAFPLILMLQMEKGAIPFQVFHDLEHLNIPYEIDFDRIDKTYKQRYTASQLLIYNKSEKTAIDTKVIKAGVYELKDDKLEFLREGYASWHLKNEGEFLLTEDVNKSPGNVYDPHERMLRFIYRGQIVDKEENILPRPARAISLIYKSLGLIEVETGIRKDGNIDILDVKRVKNAKKHQDLKTASVINTFIDQGMGIRVPTKIIWRMKGDLKIKSKKTLENIKYDLKKIQELGISVKVLERVTNNEFSKWYKIYQKYVEKKFKTTTKMNANWLNEKLENNKEVGGIFAYKNNKMIAGELFTVNNGVLGVGYSAAPKLKKLRSGLTTLLDYKFLEYARENDLVEVSFGQDTNFYGGNLNLGLLLYKSKLGFVPIPAVRTYWISVYIKKLRNIKKDIMLFGSKNRDGVLDTLYVFTRDVNEAERKYRSYLPFGVDNLEIIDMKEEIKRNKEIFKEKKKEGGE